MKDENEKTKKEHELTTLCSLKINSTIFKITVRVNIFVKSKTVRSLAFPFVGYRLGAASATCWAFTHLPAIQEC